jgi:hypothetical protein
MRRTTVRWALPVLGAVLVLGCSSTDDATEDAPPTTSTTAFCTAFPTRSTSAMLDAPDDPGLEGNQEAIDQLLELGADGLVETAPGAIEQPVGTFVAALRGYEPGADLRDDPEVRDAAAEIDAWLQANCPPPPATTPG